MKKIISVFLIAIATASPASAPAQDEPVPTAKITNVEKGERVPFGGILLDAWAFSKMTAKVEADTERFKLELDYLGKRKDAEWGLKYDSLQASFDGLQFKYDSILEIKDEEIKVLREIAVDKKDYSMWWYAGGFLSGIVMCLGVLYVASDALSD